MLNRNVVVLMSVVLNGLVLGGCGNDMKGEASTETSQSSKNGSKKHGKTLKIKCDTPRLDLCRNIEVPKEQEEEVFAAFNNGLTTCTEDESCSENNKFATCKYSEGSFKISTIEYSSAYNDAATSKKTCAIQKGKLTLHGEE